MTTHYDDLLLFPFSSKITVEKTIFNLSKTDKGGVIKSAHLSLGNKINEPVHEISNNLTF